MLGLIDSSSQFSQPIKPNRLVSAGNLIVDFRSFYGSILAHPLGRQYVLIKEHESSMNTRAEVPISRQGVPYATMNATAV